MICSLSTSRPASPPACGTPPHLDAALTFESGAVIGIESKFTEYLSRSTRGKSSFEPTYFPPTGGLWASKAYRRARRWPKNCTPNRISSSTWTRGNSLSMSSDWPRPLAPTSASGTCTTTA